MCEGINEFITSAPGVGGWGGSCTCPNGQVYQVGDNIDACRSLACINGTPGTCNRFDGKWSRNKVICNSKSETKKGCLPIEVNSKSWGSEIRWKITTHQNKATNCVGKSGYPNHSKTKHTCCLPDDKYWLHCEDTYGDGWHGGSISIAGVNYCSNFKRGKFHKPIFWIKNARVTKTGIYCESYNRHECCGKKETRPNYGGNPCVPHKNGRFPTFYAHFGFPGNECEPSAWVNRNNFQGQKGQC